MSTVTWLHISDLHWRESQAYDANVVAKALLRDLANRAEIAPELTHIDFIFMTGDIAFASRPEEYGLAQQFFKNLLQTTKVRKDRLFIVPGNHDVDRTAISDEARDIVSKLGNRQAVNDLLDHEIRRATIMQRFRRYSQFVTNYFKKNLIFDNAHYFYVKRRKVADNRWVEILGLNSAWASTSDADRLSLFLGERQVRAALDRAKRADIRIALMHHPFDWLRDFDRDDCEPLLLGECDFVLHGHMHRTGVMSLQAPGIEAMVIGAGACYDTREYRNAYNLVHLDLSSGKSTIYLRMYSDRQGGFWTEDWLTYYKARGKYTFKLPHNKIAISSTEPTDQGIITDLEEREDIKVLAQIQTSFRTVLMQLRSSVSGRQDAGLTEWWKKRGYSSNPFAWSNAADVDEKNLSELFQLWYVDPNMPAGLQGLGQTPTLDEVKSPGTSGLVLIYAPGGGGKTFYRRWAARQIEEYEVSQCAVEISNLAAQIDNLASVTARDLALCIYGHVYKKFSSQASFTAAEHVAQILKQCDEVLECLPPGQQVPRRVHVFIDDVDQLFDDHRVKQNLHALTAISDLCRVAAERGGGEPLALRMFIPIQLKKPVQKRLGIRCRQRIREYTIRWNVEHCQAIVETRLDSYWEDGPNTGIIHISRLLKPDALDEFRRWLRRQKEVSPRCVIRVFDELGRYAYRRGVGTQLIDAECWNNFLRAGEPTVLCTQGASYPLSRSPLSLLKSPE